MIQDETKQNASLDVIVRTSGQNPFDERVSIKTNDTVATLKSILIEKGVIDQSNKSKLIFSGRILVDQEQFSKVFEKFDAVNHTPTIHLVGGVIQRSPNNQATSTSNVNSTNNITTSSVQQTKGNNNNSINVLQSQLLLQQQMLLTQLMMNQLILTNNSIMTNPVVTQISSPIQTPPSQPTQNIQQQQTIEQDNIVEEQIPPQEEVQEQPQAPQQQPQRLIEENVQPQEEGYNVVSTFLKVVFLCTVLFARQGFRTWGLYTIGFFFALLLLKFINKTIHSRVVRDMERREREEQAEMEHERIVEEGGEIPENVASAISEPVGVFNTLFHVIYLFFISLAPTYVPRRRVQSEEEHED
ncbi:hypothetical protein ABK040_001121 [Willaertia magna]